MLLSERRGCNRVANRSKPIESGGGEKFVRFVKKSRMAVKRSNQVVDVF